MATGQRLALQLAQILGGEDPPEAGNRAAWERLMGRVRHGGGVGRLHRAGIDRVGRVEGFEGEELVHVRPSQMAPAITALTCHFCFLRPVWFWSSMGIQMSEPRTP